MSNPFFAGLCVVTFGVCSALPVAAGPVFGGAYGAQLLDPGANIHLLDGGVVRAEERTWLPVGDHLGHVADTWFPQISSLQHNGAGMALFDPLQLSAHGRSWTQMRYTLNGLDITDPASPGEPLLQLPHSLWDGLRFRSLWTDTPGFAWRVRLDEAHRVDVGGSWARHVDGGNWNIRGVYDREPATDYGADAERRRLRHGSGFLARYAWQPGAKGGGDGDGDGDGGEVGLSGGGDSGSDGGDGGALWLAPAGGEVALRDVGQSLMGRGFAVRGEHLDHVRRYLTLVRPGDGSEVDDGSQRTTMLALGQWPILGLPVTGLVAWQRGARDYDGAQHRWPLALTHKRSGDAVVVQLGSALPLGHGDEAPQLELGLGFGWRDETRSNRSDSPVVADIENQWMWMARPQHGGEASRYRVDMRAATQLRTLPVPLRLSLRGSHAVVRREHEVAGGRTGLTYLRGPDHGLGTAVSQTVFDASGVSRFELRHWRLQAATAPWWGPFGVEGLLALDHAGVSVRSSDGLSYWSPAAGLLGRYRPAGAWWGQELYGFVRYEPVRLTAQVGDFLDQASPSGRTLVWSDVDGDLIPDAGEEGALLGRTGGMFHGRRSGVRRPAMFQFGFGYVSPQLGPFVAQFTGIGRWLFDRYTVRYADDERFREVALSDPGGDGRGEDRLPGGGQALSAYDRDLAAAGDEIYELTGDPASSMYLGFEVQLATVHQPERWWFFNFSGAGYLSGGGAPFGAFPDRNDPGIIHESSADPNNRFRGDGRYDADRSFSINIAGGIRPQWRWLRGFGGAAVLRYRDGQPFTRILVARDLQQGPTPVMAVERGKPRHTFHMTLDVRLRYRYDANSFYVTGILDVFNLLGSGTEILEDPRTGNGVFRNALEMVPGRAVMLRLLAGWG